MQNDCTPYCAAGHFHRYPALVVLWGSKAVGSGEHAYTKLTLILTGPRPGYDDSVHHKWVYAPVTQTFPLVTSSSTRARSHVSLRPIHPRGRRADLRRGAGRLRVVG